MSSNNIYTILGKLESLTPKQQEQKPAQTVYESVEAKGSILEGVKSTEQKLNEKYMGFKKSSTVDEVIDVDTLNQLASHPMAGTIAAAGGAALGGAIGGAIKKAGDWYTKRKEQKALAAAGQKVGEGEMTEVAAPGQEDWIKKNKQRFVDQYGKEKGMSVLYATAWKRHHAANEGVAEGEVTQTKTGRIHKGSYGSEYDTDADGNEVKKSEPKKGRGRPTTKEPETKYNAPKGDIFGRTTGKAPKGTKGKVHTMNEGINFRQMADETTMSLDEMLEALQSDIHEYKQSGSCSERLRDFLDLHVHSKKQLNDAMRPENIPAVQRKTAGKDFPVSLDQVNAPGDNVSDLRNLRTNTGRDPQTGLPLGSKAPGGDLNELARLAGIATESKEKKADKDYDGDGEIESSKDEVIGSRRKAAGLDEAKPDFLDVDKDGNKKEPWKKAEKEKDQVDECMSPIGAAAGQMDQDHGRINVSTNMSSDGNKSVSINADGDAADQLMQLLKMAGLGGGKMQAQEPEAEVVIAQPMEAKDYGNIDVEEAPEYVNSPDEEIEDTETIVHQGNDLNREKKQYAGKPKAGDNPMSENIELEGRLAKLYNSIKVQK